MNFLSFLAFEAYIDCKMNYRSKIWSPSIRTNPIQMCIYVKREF